MNEDKSFVAKNEEDWEQHADEIEWSDDDIEEADDIDWESPPDKKVSEKSVFLEIIEQEQKNDIHQTDDVMLNQALIRTLTSDASGRKPSDPQSIKNDLTPLDLKASENIEQYMAMGYNFETASNMVMNEHERAVGKSIRGRGRRKRQKADSYITRPSYSRSGASNDLKSSDNVEKLLAMGFDSKIVSNVVGKESELTRAVDKCLQEKKKWEQDYWRKAQRLLITPLCFSSFTVGMWILIFVGCVDFISDAIVFESAHRDYLEFHDSLDSISNFNASGAIILNITAHYHALPTEQKSLYCDVPGILASNRYTDSHSNYSRFFVSLIVYEIFCGIALVVSIFFLLFKNLNGPACQFDINIVKWVVHILEDSLQVLLLVDMILLFLGNDGLECTVKISQWNQYAWDDELFRVNEFSDKSQPIYLFSLFSSLVSVLLTLISTISKSRHHTVKYQTLSSALAPISFLSAFCFFYCFSSFWMNGKGSFWENCILPCSLLLLFVLAFCLIHCSETLHERFYKDDGIKPFEGTITLQDFKFLFCACFIKKRVEYCENGGDSSQKPNNVELTGVYRS